jgi:hypothetical protein
VGGTAVTLSASGSDNAFGLVSGTTNASGMFTTTLTRPRLRSVAICRARAKDSLKIWLGHPTIRAWPPRGDILRDPEGDRNISRCAAPSPAPGLPWRHQARTHRTPPADQPSAPMVTSVSAGSRAQPVMATHLLIDFESMILKRSIMCGAG